MNLPDSFYIALCMTVLLLGVVYWFWSQNQYLLRKINLLENIVYELKTVCSRPPPTPMEPATYPPAPSSVVEEEELHEELLEEEEAAGDSGVRQGRASHIETRVVATRQTAASLTIAEPAFSLARSRDSLTHLLLFNNSQYSVNFLSPLDLISLLFSLF
jgi:hypothetical protein